MISIFTGHQFAQSSCLAIYSGVQAHSQGGLGEGSADLSFPSLWSAIYPLMKAQTIIEIKSAWVGPWSIVIIPLILLFIYTIIYCYNTVIILKFIGTMTLGHM